MIKQNGKRKNRFGEEVDGLSECWGNVLTLSFKLDYPWNQFDLKAHSMPCYCFYLYNYTQINSVLNKCLIFNSSWLLLNILLEDWIIQSFGLDHYSTETDRKNIVENFQKKIAQPSAIAIAC